MADTVETVAGNGNGNENGNEKENVSVMDKVSNLFGFFSNNKPEEKPRSEADISEGGGNPMYGGRKRRRKSKRNKRKGSKLY